jgi:aromatic-L-amino-acid/L-tryptophan decarboxylase
MEPTTSSAKPPAPPAEPFDSAGDIRREQFLRGAHWAVDWIADYYDRLSELPVVAEVDPGQLRAALPASAPERAEPLDSILADFEKLVLPAVTHWQHPRFLNYFSAASSGPGIIGEILTAGLDLNGMLWLTSPAVTELEEVTTGWLRDALGLPADFSGVINDTASSGTLYALAAARQAVPNLDIRRDGIRGVELRLYMSEEAHSSVEKAAVVLGVGQAGAVKIPVDAEFRMDTDRLRAAIAADREAGRVPFAVVATVGTTGVTAVDPVPDIAAACQEEGLWLHVDAAYAGVTALLPSHRWCLAGCQQADSLVVNPHKWLFVPIDCSVLYCRREEALRDAFSIVPSYLETANSGRNLMDFGTSLGRRFRALKLWFVLRAFGLEGLRARIGSHIGMAAELRHWIEAEGDFQVLAPSPFSTVVFRFRPPRLAADGAALDRENVRIHDAVNSSGRAFISHTTVRGAYALRIAIGNLQTRLEDVREAWELVLHSARLEVPSSPISGDVS